MVELKSIIDKFDPISLAEMDRVELQNRTDTKFVFEYELLPNILDQITEYYSILEINEKRSNNYKTLYYDTENLTSYHEHHNGKTNRVKVRFRNYIESKLHFLEVKFKNNKSRTIKSRTQVAQIETDLSLESKNFIKENSFYNPDNLVPVLWNSFTRLTFVHKVMNERLTIDLNLAFQLFNSDNEESVSHVVVAEVKQEKFNLKSDFMKVLRSFHIRKSSMSKYCIGTALLNKSIKSNNFKERILNIKKLKNVRRITA